MSLKTEPWGTSPLSGDIVRKYFFKWTEHSSEGHDWSDLKAVLLILIETLNWVSGLILMRRKRFLQVFLLCGRWPWPLVSELIRNLLCSKEWTPFSGVLYLLFYCFSWPLSTVGYVVSFNAGILQSLRMSQFLCYDCLAHPSRSPLCLSIIFQKRIVVLGAYVEIDYISGVSTVSWPFSCPKAPQISSAVLLYQRNLTFLIMCIM